MAKQSDKNEQPAPYFTIRFSPVEGVRIETNMVKGVIYFELTKMLEVWRMSSHPGEGMVPPPMITGHSGGIQLG